MAYAIVVSVLPIAHGFAVAGIGIVIGVSVGFLGRGIETKFALVATVFLARRALSRSQRLAIGLLEMRD